jgi:hypothetical protein
MTADPDPHSFVEIVFFLDSVEKKQFISSGKVAECGIFHKILLDRTKDPQNATAGLFAVSSSFGILTLTEQVVHRNVIEIRQANQHVGGDVSGAQLVTRVANLRTAEDLGDVCLCEIVVFPKISDLLVLHSGHSCCVIFLCDVSMQ